MSPELAKPESFTEAVIKDDGAHDYELTRKGYKAIASAWNCCWLT